MIKKFEDFVNEMYSPQANNAKELVAYLSELGVSENDCAEIYALSQKNKLYYTAEEAENILNRLPGCDSVDGITTVVKTLFFGTDEDLKEWCGANSNPSVVIGINGKLLTGEVYYCEALDAFAEDEDDFNEDGYEWLARKAEDELLRGAHRHGRNADGCGKGFGIRAGGECAAGGGFRRAEGGLLCGAVHRAAADFPTFAADHRAFACCAAV